MEPKSPNIMQERQSGMETLVLNLYSNASKYIPKDGRSHDVTTSFVRQQQGLLITVKSVGPYVPSTELEDIFKIGAVNFKICASFRAWKKPFAEIFHSITCLMIKHTDLHYK